MSNFHNNDSPFSANGRFGRLSYLGWSMLTALFIMIIGILAAILIPTFIPKEQAPSTLFSAIVIPICLVIYILLVYLNFIFTIRRLHDKNQSGWLSLLLLIPLVNFFFYFYLACAKGDQGINNYGAKRPTKTWEKVLAWVYIILIPVTCVLGILAAIAIPAYQDYTNRAQQQQYQQQINQSE